MTTPAIVDTLDLAYARDLDVALGLVRGRARDLAHDLIDALTRALDLTRTRAVARSLARDLDAALDLGPLDLDLAAALDGDFSQARVRAHDLVDALTCDVACDLDLTVSLAVALDRDLAHASNLAHAFARAIGRDSPHGVGRRRSKAAQHLVGAAARILPPGERVRYGEEFRSELAEIALAGGGRLRQLVHAARVTVRSPRLRTALTRPRQRSALL